MKSYARLVNNIYVENILPALYDDEAPDWVVGNPSRIGQEIDIKRRFTAEFIDTLVEITDATIELGMEYKDGVFKKPIPPKPSAEQILIDNTTKRDQLLVIAGLAIAPLQDAVDLDDATEAETSLLTKWKQYRVAVNRVVLTKENPTWPKEPV